MKTREELNERLRILESSFYDLQAGIAGLAADLTDALEGEVEVLMEVPVMTGDGAQLFGIERVFFSEERDMLMVRDVTGEEMEWHLLTMDVQFELLQQLMHAFISGHMYRSFTDKEGPEH
jgi:hypothetical protein